MRVCFMPLKIEAKNPSANLLNFKVRMEQIARRRPDLVCLPECAFTGYLYEENDLAQFAEPADGTTMTEVARLAREYQVYMCFGFLEETPKGVFDSAALLDRQGRTVLMQRKNTEQPPFLNGEGVDCAETEFGKLGVLICGDLFHREVVERLPRDPQLLLVPMARGFDGPSPDAERWRREERAAYVEAVRQAGVTAALVNSLESGVEEGAFGGALIVDAQGNLLAESPHGTDEILVYHFADNPAERAFASVRSLTPAGCGNLIGSKEEGNLK